MLFADNLTLLACAGVLALALLVALRGGKSPLALPLALPLVLLSLDVFLWNFAAIASDTTGVTRWHWVSAGVAPLCAPLTLHFVLAFTGRVRNWRSAVVCAYVIYGLIALLSGAGAFSERVAMVSAHPLWRVLSLSSAVGVILLSLVLLISHLRGASDPEERARTRLFLFAFNVTIVLGLAGLSMPPWLPGLYLGRLGVLFGVAILALVTLRLRLFEKDLPTSAAAETLVLACVAFAGYLGAFQLLHRNGALLTLTMALVTLALFAGLRYAFGAFATRRERVERLATLGSFSAQLAHDLKNPLAALKGAAQFLKEEWVQGRSGPDQAEYLDLIVAQADRLDRIIDRYQRLGRVQPVRSPVKLNALVRDALTMQRLAVGPGIALEEQLDDSLPTCQADPDLLGVVLDNLLRNAAEAMPKGGKLTVATARLYSRQGEEVLLSVTDTGDGMSPRTRERAFDGFFTTKAQGSGLGLAFVRRVAEAHGGAVSLTSEVGRGTVVRFRFPTR